VPGDSVAGSDWRMRTWREEHRINDVLGVTSQYRIFTGPEREWAVTVVSTHIPHPRKLRSSTFF
jgi:hypothetical protein